MRPCKYRLPSHGLGYYSVTINGMRRRVFLGVRNGPHLFFTSGGSVWHANPLIWRAMHPKFEGMALEAN